MLKQAKDLLYSEYRKCLDVVQGDSYYTTYAEEKLHHSLQVLGAGNYIIKHEPWFHKQTPEFIEIAKTAVLLHDIARFEEIAIRCKEGRSLDHGLAGYKKLVAMPEYDNFLIALPIKHHGHTRSWFYDDPEFKNIADIELKEQVDHIFMLIRDADKIANFNIVCYETEKYLPLFVPSTEKALSHEEKLSDDVVEDFLRLEIVNYDLPKTAADYCLVFISWFFDINYNTSITFCRRLDLINKMFDLLKRYHHDFEKNDRLLSVVKKYLNEKFI